MVGSREERRELITTSRELYAFAQAREKTRRD
jgi:MHS family proline/betaine transporter-like MFS transporter